MGEEEHSLRETPAQSLWEIDLDLANDRGRVNVFKIVYVISRAFAIIVVVGTIFVLCGQNIAWNKLAKKNGLIEPYEKVGESEYGVSKWKRVREDSTDLKAFNELPEFIYGLWKKARK